MTHYKGWRFYLEYRQDSAFKEESLTLEEALAKARRNKKKDTPKVRADLAEHGLKPLHAGNVIAIADVFGDGFGNLKAKGFHHAYEGAHALFDHPDSDLAWGGVSAEHLRLYCKRIPQAEAFRIHPNLAAYIKQIEESLAKEKTNG